MPESPTLDCASTRAVFLRHEWLSELEHFPVSQITFAFGYIEC